MTAFCLQAQNLIRISMVPKAQIKQEPVEQGIDSLVPATAVPRTRLLHENQRVYIEILDSDEENDSDAGLFAVF